MQPTGSPFISAISQPSGSTVPNALASCRPGFQPSPAAQSIASARSSGRMTRIVTAWLGAGLLDAGGDRAVPEASSNLGAGLDALSLAQRFTIESDNGVA